jgi:hypothetical protein
LYVALLFVVVDQKIAQQDIIALLRQLMDALLQALVHAQMTVEAFINQRVMVIIAHSKIKCVCFEDSFRLENYLL